MPQALSQIIGAMGAPEFPAVAARAVAQAMDFELATIVVHRPGTAPALLFDDFDAVGGREGVRNYVAATHRLNPMLAAGPREGAFRAGDFAIRPEPAEDGALIVRAPEEELGFRTVGWPPGLEEVGLLFRGGDGLVELACYRPRGRRPTGRLGELDAVREPMAAAFRRHAELSAAPARPLAHPSLTTREREVAELLLVGCGSEAIALRLGIGRYTVKDHRKRIFRKLGVGSLAELFALHRRAA
ncbi:MAG: helix-turn-helix transcriptional regulator [Caulobacterales bacterium]|nr:helix-turn-helix transcriptional regulator [Caulobacterales bacterium]